MASYFFALVVSSMRLPCWAYRGDYPDARSGDNSVSLRVDSLHAAMAVAPNARGILTEVSKRDDAKPIATVNTSEQDGLVNKWSPRCRVLCNTSSHEVVPESVWSDWLNDFPHDWCPDGFCNDLTATIDTVRCATTLDKYLNAEVLDNASLKCAASAQAFLSKGVPAACEMGLCKNVLPTVLAMTRVNDSYLRWLAAKALQYPCSHGYFNDVFPVVLAMANDTDQSIAQDTIRTVFPATFKAGLGNELMSMVLDLGRSGKLSFRVAIAEAVIPAACQANLCRDVLPLLPHLATDENESVRDAIATYTVPAACEFGNCTDVASQVKGLASDGSWRVRLHTATFALPAVCDSGSDNCKEMLPAIFALCRDEDLDVVNAALSSSVPWACEKGFFKEVRPMLLDILNDTAHPTYSITANTALHRCEDIVRDVRNAENQRQKVRAAEVSARMKGNFAQRQKIAAESAESASKVAEAKAIKLAEAAERAENESKAAASIAQEEKAKATKAVSMAEEEKSKAIRARTRARQHAEKAARAENSSYEAEAVAEKAMLKAKIAEHEMMFQLDEAATAHTRLNTAELVDTKHTLEDTREKLTTLETKLWEGFITFGAALVPLLASFMYFAWKSYASSQAS